MDYISIISTPYIRKIFVVLVIFISFETQCKINQVGISFGAPSLLGLRELYHDELSQWTYQLEYSKQVLFRNRGNGLIQTLRFDTQFSFLNWYTMQPFLFTGFNYLNGYLNRNSPTINLYAWEFGSGLRLPITEKIQMGGEIGGSLPINGVAGFEYLGIIVNLSLLWSWSI